MIEVHNKVDRMGEEGELYARSLRSQAGKVAVSALSGEGLDLLKEKDPLLLRGAGGHPRPAHPAG